MLNRWPSKSGPSIPWIALSLGIWGGLPACGMGDRRCRRVEGCAGRRLGEIREPREGKWHREHYKGSRKRYLVHVFWFPSARKATRGVSVVLRGELNIARARRSLSTSSQALWQSAFVHGACASDRQRMAPHGQQKAKRPHSGSDEAGAGQTGRGHVPKSKKLRVGDGSEGEMGDDGGEEVTPMDITSAGTPALGFGRDGVSRQRMLALTNLGVLTSTRDGGDRTARAQGVMSGDIPPQRAVGFASTIASCPSAAIKLRSRLSRIRDAFRLLLVACMWVMRMGGDDARSYEEASYYVQLAAKPTLVAACSSPFNWRRHVMHSANAVLGRLRKPPLTLGVFPDYIPEWALCGVRYNCNAGLADPDVTARVNWMGTGPFEGDRKEDGTKDETGA
ncbi:hypothetical protein CBR_g34591 [Chara braunii]|uniref:Uncharacterized protein n=1 Tax=Chara braunii TaxID=69332 RepID=A0A388LJ57_CHABU|nr:hypothetical protein CBR_g34591 [Chara braunii]|eukprot:GBG82307.1 hypothetical protein CBR_g34591 [Chara braunii]